jgi:Flp pilus assembly protein TadG
MRKTTNRAIRQKGGAVLEGALVFITLISMIVFVLDMGRILLIGQYVGERARTAARSAAVNNWALADVQNFVVYNNTTAPSGGGAGFLGLLPSQVNYSNTANAGTVDATLTVTVSNIPVLTFIPYISGTYTLPTIVATAPAQSLGATN